MMKSWKVRLFVVSLLLGIGYFAFKDEIYGKIKAWRYQESVSEAQDALKNGDEEEVVRLTGVALRLTSGSIEEIRQLFELASAVRSTDTIPIGELLFTHPDSRLDDRVNVLEFFSERNEKLFLEGLLGQLTKDERANLRVVAVRINLLLAKGNRLEALFLMDSLGEEISELPSLQLLKLRLLAGERGNPLAWKACRELAGRMMAGESETEALEAFRILFLLPDAELKKFAEPNLETWVNNRSNVQPADKLAAARWELLRFPEKSQEIANKVLSMSEEAPDEVARWMLQTSQQELIFDSELDLSSKGAYPFFLARLQFFLDSSDWSKAEALLEKPHRLMSASLLSGFRSAVALRTGDRVAHLSYLTEALNQAALSEGFAEYLSLFEIAKRLGDKEMRRKICERFVRLPARLLPRGERLAFLDLEFGDNPEFLASLYQKLAAAKPDDALINYRKAFLDFLVTGESEKSLQKLEELLNDFPQAGSLRCAKALILAESSPQEALAWLEGEDSDQLTLEGAFERAAYAALLRENGKVERARRIESRIAWNSLPRYIIAYFNELRKPAILE